MTTIRSFVIPAALALGVVLAPVAMAASTPSTPAAAKATTSPTSTSSTHKSTTAKAPKMHVDLNTASREQLMTLPGISGETADKIIQARPFKSKEELKSKGIVTKTEYSKLASKVSAKAEPMKK